MPMSTSSKQTGSAWRTTSPLMTSHPMLSFAGTYHSFALYSNHLIRRPCPSGHSGAKYMPLPLCFVLLFIFATQLFLDYADANEKIPKLVAASQEDAVLDATDAAELERLKTLVPQLIRLLPDALRDRSEARQNTALSEMLSGLLLRFDSVKSKPAVRLGFVSSMREPLSLTYALYWSRPSHRSTPHWWMRRPGCGIYTVPRTIGLFGLYQQWRSGVVSKPGKMGNQCCYERSQPEETIFSPF
jgi:hypothetical protein